jgi:hypothetical protein
MNDPGTAVVIFVEQPEGLCGLKNRSTSTRVISTPIVDREGDQRYEVALLVPSALAWWSETCWAGSRGAS